MRLTAKRLILASSAATAFSTQLLYFIPVYASRSVYSSALAFTAASVRPLFDNGVSTEYVRLFRTHSNLSRRQIKKEKKSRNKRLSLLSSAPLHLSERSLCIQPSMAHYYYPTIGSTQDEARKILRGESAFQPKNNHPEQTFAVSSAEQTEGRGTSGRSWIAPPGNTFLTVVFPFDKLHIIPTLLPLQIGCIVAKQIQSIICRVGNNPLQKSTDVKLKWPNDVLIHDKKIAGILIESERDVYGNYWFMVGIGVNWAIAPIVDQEGPHRGRNATCVCEHLVSEKLGEVGKDADTNEDAKSGIDSCSSGGSSGDVGVDGAKQLGYDIAIGIENWLEMHYLKGKDSQIKEGQDIVKEWETWADFGKEQILRDAPGHDVVIPLNLEPDGRLRVKESSGMERILCADYLL
mmetsp:Transcript_3946/g.4483  ORF Transcript_3946/g.4483 Transcript_3946/m.4483 type:complete len:405 (-) Transcript_3946:279-1493(-)